MEGEIVEIGSRCATSVIPILQKFTVGSYFNAVKVWFFHMCAVNQKCPPKDNVYRDNHYSEDATRTRENMAVVNFLK
jgi:hypothetical protein